MKKWKKVKIAVIITLALSLASVKVTAVELTPSVQSVLPDTNLNIAVTASPSSDATGVELRLRVTNGQVISYTTPSAGGFLVLPVCEGGTTYITATDVCIDFANTGTFGTGTDLGTLVIRSGITGTTTVEKISGNQYLLDIGGTETDEGVAGTYSISASDPTPTPTPTPTSTPTPTPTFTPTPTPTPTPITTTPIVEELPQTAIDYSSDSFKTFIKGISLIFIGVVISRYRGKSVQKV